MTTENHPSSKSSLIVRQSYLQGCALATTLDGGSCDFGGVEEDSVRELGKALHLDEASVDECIEIVQHLSRQERGEFIQDILSGIRQENCAALFLYDFDTMTSRYCKSRAFVQDAFAKPLLGDASGWRIAVANQLKGERRRTWIDHCEELAKNRDGEAALLIGYCHENGLEREKSLDLAVKWYRLASEHGTCDGASIALSRVDSERARLSELRMREWIDRIRQCSETVLEFCEKNYERILPCIAWVLVFGLLCWIIGCWHDKKVSRINSAANNILANMVAIPGVNYKIGRTEVTQEQWYGITGDTPSRFEGRNLPVESVSWDDCQDFIEELNDSEPVKKARRRFRLPTEQEWEYACRAGGSGDVGLGEDGKVLPLSRMAWYETNSPHPVATKEPNAYGLYDMHGNVFEWCSDVKPGLFWNGRINKGGAFDKSSKCCSASYRDSDRPSQSYKNTGLRLVCE